ncbi:hypothetical protein C7212DRAFT_348299 [Tuber magnatum]|uniref:Myb-like domain-containing protein n=1 Tax=Tuber magnatum TaxID=42249 RepID=A0A317SG28_9PEZI|nr:hypothetical protein C7212DRAFT_348299 [Tuber magnatum]
MRSKNYTQQEVAILLFCHEKYGEKNWRIIQKEFNNDLRTKTPRSQDSLRAKYYSEKRKANNEEVRAMEDCSDLVDIVVNRCRDKPEKQLWPSLAVAQNKSKEDCNSRHQFYHGSIKVERVEEAWGWVSNKSNTTQIKWYGIGEGRNAYILII